MRNGRHGGPANIVGLPSRSKWSRQSIRITWGTHCSPVDVLHSKSSLYVRSVQAEFSQGCLFAHGQFRYCRGITACSLWNICYGAHYGSHAAPNWPMAPTLAQGGSIADLEIPSRRRPPDDFQGESSGCGASTSASVRSTGIEWRCDIALINLFISGILGLDLGVGSVTVIGPADLILPSFS